MNDNHSRLNKFEKRRKNTNAISILIIVGSILLLFLIGLLFFGGNDNKESQTDSGSSEVDIKESEQKESEEDSNQGVEDETDESFEEENEDLTIEKESTAPSDDNVAEAYTANWKPIGTEQEGEHTTQFKKGTQDWKEMERAASIAAEINEEDMMTWMIENGGDPQKTIATVSDSNETEVYRVYLSWIDGEGWQPTKVEILKENDKK